MKLEKLKKRIIADLSELYESKDEKRCFKDDIKSARDVWDIIHTLEEYGWSKQGALDIIFGIMIPGTSDNVFHAVG